MSSELERVVAQLIDPHAWDRRKEYLERAEHWRDGGNPTQRMLADNYRQAADTVVQASLVTAHAVIPLIVSRCAEVARGCELVGPLTPGWADGASSAAEQIIAQIEKLGRDG